MTEHLNNIHLKNGINLPMPELNEKHYLRAVTELGDTRNIFAHQDIYS